MKNLTAKRHLFEIVDDKEKINKIELEKIILQCIELITFNKQVKKPSVKLLCNERFFILEFEKKLSSKVEEIYFDNCQVKRRKMINLYSCIEYLSLNLEELLDIEFKNKIKKVSEEAGLELNECVKHYVKDMKKKVSQQPIDLRSELLDCDTIFKIPECNF